MEESELLFSFLTVPYVRIPLVLNFFAGRDRVTYLFNEELQKLLRAVLFETGAWVPEQQPHPIEHIPIRKSKEQKRRAVMDTFFKAGGAGGTAEDFLKANAINDEDEVLGTPTGGLLNELAYAPDAVIPPIASMLDSVSELLEA